MMKLLNLLLAEAEYNLKLIDKKLLQKKLKEYIELAENEFDNE